MIIYSTPTCPRCKILAASFQKAGLPYEEGILDAGIIADCLCETGILTVAAPLVKDGACWFFADDFFDKSGNLKANWLAELKGVRPHKEFSGEGGKGVDVDASKCSKIWKD